MIRARKSKLSEKIDLSRWDFVSRDLDEAIKRSVAKSITTVLGKIGISANWRPAAKDKTCIELGLPFDEFAECEVRYSFSISEAITSSLTGVIRPDFTEDEAKKARDQFIAVAKAIHRTYIPSETFPEIDEVELPTTFLQDTKLDTFWNWDTYGPVDKIISHFEKEAQDAQHIIDKVRKRKVQLETALVHYKSLQTAP